MVGIREAFETLANELARRFSATPRGIYLRAIDQIERDCAAVLHRFEVRTGLAECEFCPADEDGDFASFCPICAGAGYPE